MTVSSDFRPFRTDERWYDTYWPGDAPKVRRSTLLKWHFIWTSILTRWISALARRQTLLAEQQRATLIRFSE